VVLEYISVVSELSVKMDPFLHLTYTNKNNIHERNAVCNTWKVKIEQLIKKMYVKMDPF
jgi:hypothetical protein